MALSEPGILRNEVKHGPITMPVRADVVIQQGALIAHRVGSSLAEVPLSSAKRTDLVIKGTARFSVDATGKNDGDETVEVDTSPLQGDFDNSANSDEITASDLDKIVYAYDDNTLSLTDQSSTLSPAGRLHGIADDGTLTIEILSAPDLQDIIDALDPDVPKATFQAAAMGAMVAGTVTLAAGITVAANSEVIPLLTGAVTGSTNFGSLREKKSARIVGAPGTGSVEIEAVGADGAKDADAAAASGVIRIVILTPQ